MSSQTMKKLTIAGLFCAAVVVGYLKFGSLLSLEYLATQETALRDYQRQSPALTYVLAFVIYVAVTGLSIPGATVLTLVYGWFFGSMRGVVLVSFASTTGATVAFLLSRYLFQSAVQHKFGERLEQFNRSLAKEGAFYLFTLRLIPVIPFFVINVVMGLTPLKTSTYWLVSQLGMLPATIVYVYAGSAVPTLAELAEQGTGGILNAQIVAAFVMLGLFPLIARFALAKLAPKKPKAT